MLFNVFLYYIYFTLKLYQLISGKNLASKLYVEYFYCCRMKLEFFRHVNNLFNSLKNIFHLFLLFTLLRSNKQTIFFVFLENPQRDTNELCKSCFN